MARSLFAALLISMVAFANAEQRVALPKDVPPVIGTAIAVAGEGEEWSLKLSVPKVRWEIVGEEKPKLDWPRFKVSAEESTFTLRMVYNPATQVNEIAQHRLVTLKGTKLGRKEALERLGTSGPVLVSASGRMPDPYYLQCAKADTLIVVLGLPSSPAPDLLPQPASHE